MQEWESKQALLKDLNATWHMIGHLQSNKVSRAVRLFDSIDVVDTVALAERLDRAKNDFNTEGTESTDKPGKSACVEEKKRLRVLIEVRLDPNPAKSGVNGEQLLPLLEGASKLPHLELRGLLGVPPYFDDPEGSRPYFRRLRELRDAARLQLGKELLPVLSMGMSNDFEVAIEEGATEIRVGTALFGERRKE